MKDDYLWNKTGKDSEIKKLENTLQIFRCQENQPPQISNKVISFKKESPRKLFPVFRALAASIILTFALVGIWFYSNSKTEIAQTKTVENVIQNDDSKKRNSIESIEPEKAVIETISTNEKPEIKIEKPKSKIQKQNFRVQKLIYKPKAKTQKNETVKLTEEEKEAYEKLMLALSITSSKLKIVKDKVQNTDEQTAIFTENKTTSRKK